MPFHRSVGIKSSSNDMSYKSSDPSIPGGGDRGGGGAWGCDGAGTLNFLLAALARACEGASGLSAPLFTDAVRTLIPNAGGPFRVFCRYTGFGGWCCGGWFTGVRFDCCWAGRETGFEPLAGLPELFALALPGVEFDREVELEARVD